MPPAVTDRLATGPTEDPKESDEEKSPSAPFDMDDNKASEDAEVLQLRSSGVSVELKSTESGPKVNKGFAKQLHLSKMSCFLCEEIQLITGETAVGPVIVVGENRNH